MYKDNIYFNYVTLTSLLDRIFLPVHLFLKVSKFEAFIMTLNLVTHAAVHIL